MDKLSQLIIGEGVTGLARRAHPASLPPAGVSGSKVDRNTENPCTVAMPTSFLLVLVPIFVVVDPFGALPLYVVMTKNMTREARRKTLYYGITFAAALLLVFVLAGKAILDYLTISIDALRITGGLLLAVIGISMLYEGDIPRSRRSGPEETQQPEAPEDVAFVPLGTPLIAGPGAISVVILHAGTSGIGLTIAALLVVMLITAALLFRSDVVFKLLGNAGTRALTRVLGVITVAYAVQMVLDGIRGYVLSV